MDPNTAGLIGTWVGTAISVLAFFASLMLYIKGRDLQDSANKALTELSERTNITQQSVQTIQTRLLDAVIAANPPPASNATEIETSIPADIPFDQSESDNIIVDLEDTIYYLKKENEELEHRLSNLSHNLLSQAFYNGEIDPHQMKLLLYIYNRGFTRIEDISEGLSVSKLFVMDIAGQLIAKGMIEPEIANAPNKEDSWEGYIITEKGNNIITSISTVAPSILESLSSSFRRNDY